jgi:hypothetical protein
MAISNLVSPGQASERPSVSAFFGQSYTSGATQKVSSTMMSDSFVDSTMNMLKGLTTEIARIQATAKKTLAGFDKVINSIRELNRSITMRFRTLNNELTASRVDFLRGVLNAPEMPAPDLGGAPILVMKNDQPAATPTPAPNAAPSLLDMLMSAAGEAILGQAITKMFTSGGTIVKTLISALVPLIFNPGVLGAAGFIALAYFAGKARAENPEGFVEFMNKMKTGGEKSKVITGPEEETKKFGPLKESGIITGPEILKRNNLTQQDVVSTKFNEATKSNIMTVKDGRWIDLSSKSDKLQPPETHPDYVEPGYTTPSGNLLKEPQTPAQKSQANRTKAAAPVATAPAPATPAAAAPAPATPAAAPSGAPTRGSLKGALNNSLPVAPPTDTGGQDEGTPTKKPDDKGGPSPEQLKDAQKEPGVGDVDPDNKGMQPDIVAEKPTKLSMSAENPKNNLLSVDSVERMMDTKVIQMAETVRMQSTNRTGATNQPIVMNNSSTTNSSSSSGGEGNNVSGQNFPLTAINPHIQEFLQKQNMQYQ